MDFGNARQLLEKSLHRSWIDSAGDGVEHETDGVAQQSPGADENDHHDDQAADRVEQRPACFQNNEACDDHSGRNTGISCHVEKCPADVEVAFASAREHPGSHTVNQYPGRSDPDHRYSDNVLWLAKASNRFRRNRTHPDE